MTSSCVHLAKHHDDLNHHHIKIPFAMQQCTQTFACVVDKTGIRGRMGTELRTVATVAYSSELVINIFYVNMEKRQVKSFWLDFLHARSRKLEPLSFNEETLLYSSPVSFCCSCLPFLQPQGRTGPSMMQMSPYALGGRLEAEWSDSVEGQQTLATSSHSTNVNRARLLFKEPRGEGTKLFPLPTHGFYLHIGSHAEFASPGALHLLLWFRHTREKKTGQC